MRAALAGDRRPQMEGHFVHCLGWLRQMALCVPDLTFEPVDGMNVSVGGSMDGNFGMGSAGSKPVGAVHVYGDWRQVYEGIDEDFEK